MKISASLWGALCPSSVPQMSRKDVIKTKNITKKDFFVSKMLIHQEFDRNIYLFKKELYWEL